jgi:hypothetical protein
MLKVAYTESGLHIERLNQSVEEWRFDSATHVACWLTEPGSGLETRRDGNDRHFGLR